MQMKRRAELIRWEWLQIIRERFTILFLLPGLVYLGFGLHEVGVFGYNQLAWFQQAMYFWAALTGFRKAMENEESDYSEWIRASRAEGEVLAAQLGSLVLYAWFVMAAVSAVAVGMGISAGRTGPVLGDLLWTIVLHYGLGLLAAAVFGYLAGTLLPNNSGYAAALVPVFFFGPLGYDWLRAVGRHVPEGVAKTLIAPLELGTHRASAGIVPLYGFENEPALWVRHGLFLAGLILILLFLYMRKTGRRPLRLLAVTGLSVLFLGAVNLKWDGYLHNGSFQYRSYDEGSVALHETETPLAEASAFRWKNLNLAVDTGGDTLTVQAEGTAVLIRDTDTLTWNLYRGLVPDQLKINSRAVPFQTEGDLITADLSGIHREGEKLHVAIHYAGRTPWVFPVTKKAVFLPSYFNWIPQPGRGPAVTPETVLQVQTDAEPDLQVRVNGRKNAFVHASAGGVTLADGLLHQGEADGLRYIFTQERHPDRGLKSAQVLLHAMKETASWLDLPAPDVRTVVGITRANEKVGGWIETSRLSGDTLFVQYTEFYTQEMWENRAAEPGNERVQMLGVEALLALLYEEYGFLLQAQEQQRLFVDSYSLTQFGVSSRHMTDERLNTFLESEKDLLPFYRHWLDALRNTEPFTTQDLYALMDQYKGDAR